MADPIPINAIVVNDQNRVDPTITMLLSIQGSPKPWTAPVLTSSADPGMSKNLSQSISGGHRNGTSRSST